MSDFVVSARKYRPQTFSSVVGQKSITSTLKNAIKTDHLAQAFLFCGSRGVGKTTSARILAKTINCFNRTEAIEACDSCDSCVSFNTGNSLNVYELDAASNNSVDDIRRLIDQVRIAPQLGQYKIYIIDEVHMLSPQAFNAFLKTLEEPPKHAIFILATTEKHKIIPTILSRCQIFDFNRIKVKDIADHLAYIATQEGISADSEALHLISQKADGALRDALSIFDQLVTFSGTTLTYKQVIENLNILDYDYYFRIVETADKADIPSGLLLLNDVYEKGFDGHHFIIGLANHYRNLLVCKDVRTAQLLEVGESVQQRYIDQANAIDHYLILRALGVLSKTDVEYKSSKNQRLLVEMAVMQLCSLKQELEKKKWLTDPVELIPFPNQALRDKVTPANKPLVPSVPSQSIPSIPLEKVAEKPVGTLNTTHLSIKKILERKEVELQANSAIQKDLPRNSFILDDVKMLWRRHAFEMKEKGLETYYNALIKREPIIDDEVFILEVDNQIQIDYITPNLPEMIGQFRKALNNYFIDIQLRLNENPDKEVKFLSGKDKFAALARKNPNLHTLKNTFNLDIEY